MHTEKTIKRCKTELCRSLEDSPIDPSRLSPFQKVLLITDGTLTNLLEIFSEEPASVFKLSEKTIHAPEDISPLEVTAGTEILAREILLRGQVSHRTLIYASSIIVPSRIDRKFRKDLVESYVPIGKLWINYKVEAFKEIIHYTMEQAGELSGYFSIEPEEMLLSRTYRVFSDRQPVMMITEEFPETYFR
uniref:Chorismate lyase n=1 Tax=Candidatus Kentrum sp. FW TaxID=2126338 RepID=A0A450S804_9GAMM|nr:MAG: chorismate lyase [Candidatus Kentron sp. FW]VFJ51822.1 MAG: chorismate lyase [Candidatus Kentron sp. FW]